MSVLLELEKKNQEYLFNYNCLSPLNKKELLYYLGKLKKIDMSNPLEYDKLLHDNISAINQYYTLIQNGENSKNSFEYCFHIKDNEIPISLQCLSFANSGIVKDRNYYLSNRFFNHEFDKYWEFIVNEISNRTGYNIQGFNNFIFKNAFINIHTIKYNKANKTLESYYQDIINQKELLGACYNVDAKYLNNYPIMKLLSTALVCCDSTLYDEHIRSETKNIIKNLYNLLEPASLKYCKKVA